MKHNLTYLLLLLIFLNLILVEISNLILNSDLLIFNSLSEKLGKDQVIEILNLQKKWDWVGYIFVPIFILIKTTLIATVLYIGIAFSNAKITFKSCSKIGNKRHYEFRSCFIS